MDELKELEEMNTRYKERNEQLKKEQKEHIRQLFKKAKEQDKEVEGKEIINEEQIEQAMKEYVELIKQNKQQVQEILSNINDVEQKILTENGVKEYWLEYKNDGSVEHAKYIKLQENELVQLAKSFNEMKDHFRRALDRSKENTDKLTKEQMDKKKAFATQKAISYMGRYSRQEVRENEWLKKELKQYSLEVANLEQAVQKIEEENLEVLSQLFDCQISDLNICRNSFETCVVGPEGQDSRVLEDNLAELEVRSQPSAKHDDVVSNLSRPKSATLLAVEKKVLSMQPYFKEEKTDHEDEPQFQLGKSVSQNLTYLLQEDEKYFEHLECGALEQRLLHIEGRAMPLQVIEQPSNQGTRTAKAQSNQAEMGWPVTGAMLRSAVL
ncbi:coiled-coil domain-containing protein 83 isoform X2 [Heptranchias perlo]